MSPARIAVVMPARNAERHIGQALASLLRQGGDAGLDILVVDDGSTDGTRDIVGEIGRDAPVRLIASDGRGIAAGRNTALAHMPADAQFVTFLDADDLSPPGRFRRDLGYFAAEPELDLVFGSMRIFHELDDERLEPKAGGWSADVRGMQLGAGLFRASLVRDVGGFDTAFTTGEDIDFLLRIFERRPRYRLTEDICVFYRRHEANTSRDFAEVRKGYMRAMMGSARRRKSLGDFRYPADLFDGSKLARMRGS